MITTNLKQVGTWVYDRMGDNTWTPIGKAAIGGGYPILRWGVVYERYTGRSVHMHTAIAKPHAVTKNVLRMVFNYPFNQLKVTKVVATVDSSDRRAKQFVRGLGFQEECCIKDIYPDGDLLLFTMTKPQCRWLVRNENGQQSESPRAA